MHIDVERQVSRKGLGWEYQFVANVERPLVRFRRVYDDIKADNAARFLREAVEHFRGRGILCKMILTDYNQPFSTRDFEWACVGMSLNHRFTCFADAATSRFSIR